ncbi:hypothetical protein LEP1GSC005_1845 [Leptospira santarosai str. ST188]|nr:hypothetical protein LEP1GSC005_1845 [Leptospira santarosai str. ST188]
MNLTRTKKAEEHNGTKERIVEYANSWLKEECETSVRQLSCKR